MKYKLTILMILMSVLAICQPNNHNYNELKESLIAFSFSPISEKSNLERFKRENSEDSISRFDRASTYRIKNSKYQQHQRQNVMSYIITLSSALALCFMILILNPDG